MVRVYKPTLLCLACKMTVAANVAILFFMNFKATVFQGNRANTSASVNETVMYIPKCFDSIQQLANNTRDTRWRMDIRCNQSEPSVTEQKSGQNQEPCRLSWQEHFECLKKFIKIKCFMRPGHTVPNIVHYVWFGHNLFRPEAFVSVLSVIRFQQPCAILFHGNESPYGPYWEVLLSIVSNIILVQRDEPEIIFGKKFGFIQHKADIVRLEVLKAVGGIYMDTDQFLVRGVHELLNESVVMSHENKNNLANSMIVARAGAPFLDLWYAEYRWYMPRKWGYHSTYVPWFIAGKHPEMIKVVDNRFINPDLTNILKVINNHYDISSNYGLHLYTRFYPKIQFDTPHVTARNSSLGRLWRTILFDSPEMFNCSTKSS